MIEIPKLFDLHGHTKFSVPPEGVTYNPADVIHTIKGLGFDGVAITGHNTVAGLEEALDIAQQTGVILVPGIEITSLLPFRTPHILALGIDPRTVSRFSIPVGRNPQDIVKWIHDHDGLAIAAHPSEKPKLTALTPSEIARLREPFDGIEVVTLSGYNYGLKRFADEQGLAATGGSDFHLLSQIGLAGTFCYGEIQTWQDVMRAIRSHNIEAFVQTDIPPKLAKARSENGMMNKILRIGKGK